MFSKVRTVLQAVEVLYVHYCLKFNTLNTEVFCYAELIYDTNIIYKQNKVALLLLLFFFLPIFVIGMLNLYSIVKP